MSTPPLIVLPAVNACFLGLPRNLLAGGVAQGSSAWWDVEGEAARGMVDSEGSQSDARVTADALEPMGKSESLSSRSMLLTLSRLPSACSKATSKSRIGSTESSSSLLYPVWPLLDRLLRGEGKVKFKGLRATSLGLILGTDLLKIKHRYPHAPLSLLTQKCKWKFDLHSVIGQ